MAEPVSSRDMDPDEVLRSYRYLRVALPLLLLFIFAAIVLEWRSTPTHCLRLSISDYYYTPARAVFTGALVALGVCLIALRGRRPVEDTFLNLAGMSAFLVALVPTSPPDPDDVAQGLECWSVQVDYANTRQNVENNVPAFLAVSAVALVVVGVLLWSGRRRRRADGEPIPRVWSTAYAFTWLLWLACGAWLALSPATFLGYAHVVPAVLLFGSIGVVVGANSRRHRGADDAPGQGRATGVAGGSARSAGTGTRPGLRTVLIRRNPYPPILRAMIASVVVIVALHLTTSWRHWLFALEGVELALFATFWILQTLENWQRLEAGAPTIEEQQAAG